MLEKLITMSKEEVEKYIDGLDDTSRQSLITEINEAKKKDEAEVIRLETMKTKLEEDEKEIMKELAEYGINSYENLDAEINRLTTEVNKDIGKYIEALKGEI